MKKYYVRWGRAQMVLLAVNDVQACMLACRRILSTDGDGQWVDKNETLDEIVKNVSQTFVVSERGFESHEDDILYSAINVLRLVRLASDPFVKEQLKNPTLTFENITEILEIKEDDYENTNFDT